jgi:hypothetical protein
MKKKNQEIVGNNTFTEFLLYITPNGKVKVEVFLCDGMIWLTQAKIGELFAVNRPAITKHLENIYSEGELEKNRTCSKMEQVQNKLHFAITGKTAAEIIHQRADNVKPHMGLTTWKNSPNGAIRESDVVIAKNYLNEKELDYLNKIVTMYLDYAEMQADRGIMMYMKDWVAKLDAFLKFNEREILMDSGKISQEVAQALAMKKYGIYKKEQDRIFESDFDRDVRKFLGNNKNDESND